MLLLAWTGQRAAALKQFEDCRQMLATTLDVEPAEETIVLYERIHAGDLSGADDDASVILPPFLTVEPAS